MYLSSLRLWRSLDSRGIATLLVVTCSSQHGAFEERLKSRERECKQEAAAAEEREEDSTSAKITEHPKRKEDMPKPVISEQTSAMQTGELVPASARLARPQVTRAQLSRAADARKRQVRAPILAQQPVSRWALLLLTLTCAASALQQVTSSSSPASSDTSFSDQLESRLLQQQAQPQQQPNFDASIYKNLYEAIRGHPELREFAKLCEASGVKQIISMDKMPLTVFAPIDRSLSDLLDKAKSRSINLIELTKHHIAQGLIVPDENSQYPLKFSTYSLLSPLYLNQVSQPGKQAASFFVNNAKIVATHLIRIDTDTYQTLHVLDHVLEFAYLNRRTQLRQPPSLNGGGAFAAPGEQLIKRGAFSLDDLFGAPEAAQEFHERFGDLAANQPAVDQFHVQAFAGSQQQRLALARDQFNLDRLARALRQHPSLRGRLFNVNESSSLNTYFLPVASDELERLLEGPMAGSALTFEALVVPDQVLFTRALGLGAGHPTLFERSSSGHLLKLSLAKTLPEQSQEAGAVESDVELSAGRRLLSTPLLVQADCRALPGAAPDGFHAGVTSAQVLVANIPLTNGVLHLIRKPLLVSETNIMDYLNDHDNQLSEVVNALGSRTSAQGAHRPVKVNRFRELLARERQVLATLTMDATLNKTILAPSDQAFARLRFDLRALVQGDEALIPAHWDASYRHDLLERLVKRHLVLHQSLTSDQIAGSGEQQILSENGHLLGFSSANNEYQVESGATKARLVHHDLIGSNGVLHVIDRVLGEEQETVYSLMSAQMLRYRHALDELGQAQAGADLGQLIQSNIRSLQQGSISSQNSLTSGEQTGSQQQVVSSSRQSPELLAVSKTIGQYLEELASTNARQLELLASSVNVSFYLAKLTAQAEGLEDWNDRFKQSERMFTYFVPSDLAWLKLQQAQPELYKPLMYFLEQNRPLEQQVAGADAASENGISVARKSPRSSESSHRLRQILERHLVANRKIGRKELQQLDSLQTLGATLRLSSQEQHSLTDEANSLALHSIAAGQQQNRFKSLNLEGSQANIVQVNEASNGFVYVIDNVLLLPNDSDYVLLTSASPAVSSSMSSLLGAHNSAVLDFIHGLLAPAPFNLSAQSVLALLATLSLAIVVLLVAALVLLVRRRRLNKLHRHQQLESGLTSSSSASNSGSTSTTKSL